MQTKTSLNPKNLLTIPLYALALCCATMTTALAGGNAAYDADSWKTMISDDCMAYFDGCNNCRRAEGSAVSACTRKACGVYEEPRCLDEPITEGSVGMTPSQGRLVKFACDGDNRLRVYYGEYVSGDQRVALGAEEIMLVDEQTHTAHRLERERAASGAKYSDRMLEFWEHGGEATLSKEGEKFHHNCKPGE